MTKEVYVDILEHIILLQVDEDMILKMMLSTCESFRKADGKLVHTKQADALPWSSLLLYLNRIANLWDKI